MDVAINSSGVASSIDLHTEIPVSLITMETFRCRNCSLINQSTERASDVSKTGIVVDVYPEFIGYAYTIQSVIIGIVLFSLIILTVAGNIIVLLAVFSNRKLRTVSNMFIVSLSLTDLFVGTIVMMPAALNEIFDQWILAREFCSIWVSFDVMLTSASILNVCLISIDRYIAIMTPLRYRTLMTNRRAILMLCVAWGISILSSFVPVENGLHNPEMATLENLTIFSEQPQCIFIVSFPYAVIAGSVTILLPIIVALTLYWRVSKEAKRQAFLVGSLITAGNVLLGQHVASKHIREPFTRKATVTLGIIVGAFVVTWTPFLIANNIDAYFQVIPPKVFTAFVWLGYCNSLINPIIYPLFMRDFRKVYKSMFTKCCPYVRKIKSLRKDRVYRCIPSPKCQQRAGAI
ncbi:5-hydroxytryptamine receptor 6-like [Mizuhopecten yessoensis]|uniref:5-hydroxytryptamine receptor 6 n=1 Tax=Mizuhopecten yessoensis TaxID=6573 RepID=A0A210R373_MIZYE|nr:5-hydroxytryptamine receptor 6-like [Mizuhopecten yessoensis]XP_021369728.1 5-hydroxytryptamine receptor 6-like [Mizuhopecten yessoensis]XP_021369736.1 5-hydroxytryptamine receptor 6-like [Mizuhopecten yessoensis]OWF55376.1 5-hydroxytryptamine receptor 6 [Mizuhopecten yessoensis]